jgi:hypothetical protein
MEWMKIKANHPKFPNATASKFITALVKTNVLLIISSTDVKEGIQLIRKEKGSTALLKPSWSIQSAIIQGVPLVLEWFRKAISQEPLEL